MVTFGCGELGGHGAVVSLALGNVSMMDRLPFMRGPRSIQRAFHWQAWPSSHAIAFAWRLLSASTSISSASYPEWRVTRYFFRLAPKPRKKQIICDHLARTSDPSSLTASVYNGIPEIAKSSLKLNRCHVAMSVLDVHASIVKQLVEGRDPSGARMRIACAVTGLFRAGFGYQATDARPGPGLMASPEMQGKELMNWGLCPQTPRI
jgi:hypothetical protein